MAYKKSATADKKAGRSRHPSATTPEHVARAQSVATGSQVPAGSAHFPTSPGGCSPVSGGSTVRVEATGSEFRSHVNLGGTGERS